MKNILGCKGTDKVTGLTGVITAKAEFLYAPPRIEISPTRLHESKPIEGYWIDEPRLTVGAVRIKVGVMPQTVRLGDKVKDTMTGFKGIATGRLTFLNGCIRIEITSDKLKDGKPIESVTVDEQRITGQETGLPGGPRPGPTPYSTPK